MPTRACQVSWSAFHACAAAPNAVTSIDVTDCGATMATRITSPCFIARTLVVTVSAGDTLVVCPVTSAAPGDPVAARTAIRLDMTVRQGTAPFDIALSLSQSEKGCNLFNSCPRYGRTQ